MNIINLTPHDVVFYNYNTSPDIDNSQINKLIFPFSNKIAKVALYKTLVSTIYYNDITLPVYTTVSGEVQVTSPDTQTIQTFPDKRKDVMYIVPNIVKHALINREDVAVPYYVINNGNILGCKGLLI